MLARVLGWALVLTGLAALAVAVFRSTSPYGAQRQPLVWPYLAAGLVLLPTGGLLALYDY